jgi:hypothetical protein
MKAGSSTRNTEVCKFDKALLGSEDVRAFNIPMDDTLIMKIEQTM